MISKCRHNIEPLRDFAKEIVEPFRSPGPSPFIDWYRAVSARVPCVRCIFSETPVYNERILKLRLENLDTGCFGEHHREEAINVERGTTHLDLFHADPCEPLLAGNGAATFRIAACFLIDENCDR